MVDSDGLGVSSLLPKLMFLVVSLEDVSTVDRPFSLLLLVWKTALSFESGLLFDDRLEDFEIGLVDVVLFWLFLLIGVDT